MDIKIQKKEHKNRISQLRGVFTLEYLLVFMAIFAGILAMYVFTRQIISGKFRQAADAFGSGRQFEPYGEHRTLIEDAPPRKDPPLGPILPP